MKPTRKTRAVKEAPTTDGQSQDRNSKRNRCKAYFTPFGLPSRANMIIPAINQITRLSNMEKCP
jgi:hypothetical protein